MNKTDLVSAIADEAGIPKDKAAMAVESMIGCIQTALTGGDEVRLPGFGNFKVSDRKATTARNPRTGETVDVPATKVAKFSPGKSLKEALNPDAPAKKAPAPAPAPAAKGKAAPPPPPAKKKK